MPPKTPKTPKTPSRPAHQIEWKECSACATKFASKDAGKHDEICSSLVSKNILTQAPHGFIQGRKFYALSESNECAECLNLLPESEKAGLVLMSPSAMQLCGIELSSHVLVEKCGIVGNGGSKFVTGTAWPCSHFPAASINMSSERFAILQPGSSELLRVTSISGRLRFAAELVIQTTSTDVLSRDRDFISAFLFQHQHSVVSQGQKLSVKFYGQRFNVSIVSAREESESAVDNLCDDLRGLEVNGYCSARMFYRITATTKAKLANSEVEKKEDAEKKVTMADFGGSSDVVEELKKICSCIFSTNSKARVPKGVLLYGPSGTGKTLLAQAVAVDFRCSLVTVQGPELFSKFYGETETKLRSKFEEAVQNAPSVIFLDEIDAICPRRDSGTSSGSDQERRVIATLLTALDSLGSQPHVLVIGATNRPDALDPALRRPGRLDRELELRVPSVNERADVLSKILRKFAHNLDDSSIKKIASATHGFVGADLSLLCAEASLVAAKRITALGQDSEELVEEDLRRALVNVKPSAMREVLVEVPNVRWTDIGGQDDLKLKLRQAVEWPLKHPEAFQRLGVDPPRGLLMFGPPGCSKTMIAKALATESGLNFIAVKGPELFSKWVGESERAVREVFRRARQVSPAIIFLDELDALGAARGAGSTSGVGDRVLAQLLTEMDGVEVLRDVTVVAATNRPDLIDKALLRPGRLDRIVYVPLPGDETRREIFRLKFRSMPISQQVDIEWLVQSTRGYSGAEITAVCHEAALRALEEDINAVVVLETHFQFALSVVTPRITKETMAFYEKYVKESALHAL